MPRNIFTLTLLALCLPAAHPPPGRARGGEVTYEVYAVSYGVIPDFPVASLVAGADRSRKMDI
jgi:hypothetical protein